MPPVDIKWTSDQVHEGVTQRGVGRAYTLKNKNMNYFTFNFLTVLFLVSI
jgi:hypothetical protein